MKVENGVAAMERKCPCCDGAMAHYEEYGTGELSWLCFPCDYEEREAW